jgi:predicted Zn-dependent peptidase
MRKAFLPLVIMMILSGMAISQDEMQFPVREFKLDNGLTFLVVERHTAPVFSGFITVQVGSGYERIGNIGSAHLLEHMMFKGSQSVGTSDFARESEIMAREDSVYEIIDMARRQIPYIKLNSPEKLDAHMKYIDELKAVLDSLSQMSSQYVIQNEFDEIYTRNGAAEFNAFTGYDNTSYIVSLPSNRLELWFAMESDRLKHPAFREFYPERDVVSEERRLSVENNSDSKLYEQLIGTAYIAHPYQVFWEWQSEENNLKRSDIEEFFRTYYIPQRMTIAVAGDVNYDDVRKMAEKYFGDIPPGKMPEPIYTVEPEQPGERRVEVLFEANPAVFIAYHKTSFDSPEEPTFQVINRLLGDGRTSRLYKSLVLEQQLCLDISTGFFPGGEIGDMHPGLFLIFAYPKEGISAAEVETAIYQELAKLISTPVEEKELTKIKNNIDAAFIWGFHSNMGLAGKLALTHSLAGDWRNIIRFRDRLKAVTAADIMSVAAKYFQKENRTVATLIPKMTGGEQ